MKIIPLGERVVILPDKPEEKTKSGIYLPKESEEKKQGIVLDVGTLKDGSRIPLHHGDRVLYSGYSSEEIEIKGEKHLIVDYKDIIAKIED
jgi:chaperonin GroES